MKDIIKHKKVDHRDEKHGNTPDDQNEASTPHDGYSQDEFDSDED